MYINIQLIKVMHFPKKHIIIISPSASSALNLIEGGDTQDWENLEDTLFNCLGVRAFGYQFPRKCIVF